jgi:predicted helicase
MATFETLLSSFDPDTKGQQFEHFVKWFLRNDPEWLTQVDQVWLWDEYPDRWGRDCGIDLVFKHQNGEIWAVQAKCYAPEYSITKSDVDTFLSESNRPGIDRRLLIASTDRIGANARQVCKAQHKPVTLFLYSAFEQAAIEYPDHIADIYSAKRKQRPNPRPHQLKAIDAVEIAFQDADRGQLIMACGTGKTYTTLWIKERLSSQSTLVLLPSLSLLSQTLREWTFASHTPFHALCVCSDETVGKKSGEDAIISTVQDVSFPTTSDALEVCAFLQDDGDKVIFSTYHSSPVIAEAQTNDDVPMFDLVIADEAHRCTGETGKAFTTVLDQSQIKAKKRLFATATPRTYSTNLKKNASERGVDVTGMDDESVFGTVFHALTFGQAIEAELLTDYQVVIIGVDQPMIAKWIENRELVRTDSGEATDAKSLASQIGLIKAIKDYDLKRMISFHSRVKGAETFASEIHGAIDFMSEEHRPGGVMWTGLVSGKMSAHERRLKLDKLKKLTSGDRGLLSNARCLSEGVDVPSLDGVAFIDPKSSQVDIVQAVGRAIRLSEDKTVGTIILPVFIEDGDDAESSIQTSHFKPVWDVLNALKSHDEVLSFELDKYRTEMGRKGSTSGPGRGSKVIVDLPQTVDVSFADSLRTCLVEQTTSSWNFWFGLLEAFVIEKD